MIRFRKPYERVEDGVQPNAIVMYRQDDFILGKCDCGRHIVAKEKIHGLRIDLWLFVLSFVWNTKTKEECEPLEPHHNFDTVHGTKRDES